MAELTSNPRSAAHIKTFFASRGVRQFSRKTKFEDYLVFEAAIATWEEILQTEFYLFRQRDSNADFLRTFQYILPPELEGHASAILNAIDFSLRWKKSHRSSRTWPVGAAGGAFEEVLSSGIADGLGPPRPGYVTPAFLNSHYGISSNTGSTLASQSVYESLGQTYSTHDLSVFQTHFNLPQDKVDKDVGGHNITYCPDYNDGGGDCIEANLDVSKHMCVS